MRWSRGGLHEELRALTDAFVDSGPVPPNISIVVGESKGARRGKHIIYVQGRLFVAAAGTGQLYRTLLRTLSELSNDPGTDALQLNAIGILDDAGNVVAVDERLAADLQKLEPRLRRRGYRMLGAPFLTVDRAGAIELQDAVSRARVDRRRLDDRWPLRPGDDDLAGGTIPIDKVIHASWHAVDSNAARLAQLTPLVQRPDRRVRTVDLQRLAAFVGQTPLVPSAPGRAGALEHALFAH